MEGLDGLRLRAATPRDAAAIARLHAESWRRHYRGAYSDAFLDGDVLQDRLAVWTARLRGSGDRESCTFVVETATGDVAAFAHTILDEDSRWGALLDNLHVAHTHARRGIGTRLLAATGAAVAMRRPGSPLHLWVLEQNRNAQAFYTARGGRCVERDVVPPPGGDPARLHGSPIKLRYAWTTMPQ